MRRGPGRLVVWVGAAMLILAACGQGEQQAAEESPAATAAQAQTEGPISVSFGLKSPVVVEMAAKGIRIAAADPHNVGAGHYDLMVDVPCVTPGEVIPSDPQHTHISHGADTAELKLPPGQHTLCVQVATTDHVALDATEEMVVTVHQPTGD